MRESTIGVAIVAHGSDRPTAERIVHDHADALIQRKVARHTMVGFLMGPGPSLETAVHALAATGADVIVCAPYFLGRSRFVTKVIPETVHTLREQHSDVPLVIADSLPLDHDIAGAVSGLIREIDDGDGCGIVLVAHGGEKSRIAGPLEQLSAMVGRTMRDATMRCALLEGGGPSIQQAILDCTREGPRHVIIAPLFLLEGHHTCDDIPREVQRARDRVPGIPLHVTRPLGASPSIPAILERRIVEAIDRASPHVEDSHD